MRSMLPVLATMVWAILMLGCSPSHGGGVVPDLVQSPDNQVGAPAVNPVRDASDSGHHCFGYSLLKIDTENYEIEVTPLRSPQLHLNVTGVLNSTMGVTAVGVPGEHDPANGIFTFDITLAHPFPEKPTLTGFDVKGILISPGGTTIKDLTFGQALLLNGDGYSRWWNPTEFTEPGVFGYVHGNLANQPPSVLTAQVNPYKYFADILGAETDLAQLYSVALDDDQGRGVFSAGASNTRRYRMMFPMDPGPEIRYGYAIDASWAMPAVKPPSAVPDDFPIEANQPEAYVVDLEVTRNSLFYDTESGNSGGVLRVKTTIHDWQGQLNGNTFPEVSSVKVYCPMLYSGGVDYSVGGTVGDSAVFLHDLTGIAQPSWPFDVTLAVEVTSSDGTTYDQGFGYPAPPDAVAAWDITKVSVEDPPCEADANNDFDTGGEIGLRDFVIDHLCAGVDDVDYYQMQIPYGQEVEFGTLYACSNLPCFTLALYDHDFNVITQDSSSQEPEIDLSGLDLHSGTYYTSVSTSGGSGEAATYFLETEIWTESLPPLEPSDISTGFLDLEADWLKKHGDYVYMAGDTGIWVYDVSDQAKPLPVYRSYQSVERDPAFFWPHMYFLTGDPPVSLHYINFTDPSQPVDFGEILTFASHFNLMTICDDYLYFYEGETGLVYIYVYENNPAYPTHVVNFDAFHGARQMQCLCPDGSYTSLLMMSNDIFITYNVEDVFNVQQTGFEILDDTMNKDFDIYVDYIYKVNTSLTEDRLRVYHVDPPGGGLILDGSVELPEEPGCVAGAGYFVYVACADSENIVTVDCTTPTAPVVVSSDDIGVEIEDMETTWYWLYGVTKYRGFGIYDLSGTGVPKLVASVPCLNNPELGVISKDVGYYYDHRDDYGALKTVGFSDPGAPEIVDDYEYNGGINDIEVTWEGVYVLVDVPRCIDVYALTGPGQLSWVMSYNLAYEPLSAAIKGDIMYVGFASQSMMKMFDVSNPATFGELGLITIQTPVEGLIVHGCGMYGIRNNTVTIYDLTDSQNPDEQVSWDAGGYDLKCLGARDHYLYVSTATDLLTLDISDALSPVLADTLGVPSPPEIQFMTLDGLYLFSSSSEQHPYATDISLPGSPEGYATPFSPDPIAAITGIIGYHGYLYEMTEGSGVRVWDLYP